MILTNSLFHNGFELLESTVASNFLKINVRTANQCVVEHCRAWNHLAQAHLHVRFGNSNSWATNLDHTSAASFDPDGFPVKGLSLQCERRCKMDGVEDIFCLIGFDLLVSQKKKSSKWERTHFSFASGTKKPHSNLPGKRSHVCRESTNENIWKKRSPTLRCALPSQIHPSRSWRFGGGWNMLLVESAFMNVYTKSTTSTRRSYEAANNKKILSLEMALVRITHLSMLTLSPWRHTAISLCFQSSVLPTLLATLKCQDLRLRL